MELTAEQGTWRVPGASRAAPRNVRLLMPVMNGPKDSHSPATCPSRDTRGIRYRPVGEPRVCPTTWVCKILDPPSRLLPSAQSRTWQDLGKASPGSRIRTDTYSAPNGVGYRYPIPEICLPDQTSLKPGRTWFKGALGESSALP